MTRRTTVPRQVRERRRAQLIGQFCAAVALCVIAVVGGAAL